MNRRNYQKELEVILTEYGNMSPNPPRLFLHSCCAPCSSCVMEYLRNYFSMTVFYYNPNISYLEEYRRRVEEQKRLIRLYNKQGIGYPISVVEGDYEPDLFYDRTKGMEDCPEGGERCFACYRLRLQETARRAAEGVVEREALSSVELGSAKADVGNKYDYFTTTLTISPLKNAVKLNEIGEELSRQYGVRWLPSDFKKKNGYQRSVQLSKEYGLYRQDYCGCAYSRAERLRQKGNEGYRN